MIKTKEIHARFDHLVSNAKTDYDYDANKLSDELARLQAQRVLEVQLVNETVTRDIPEKESALLQKQEQTFFKEKKELINHQNGVKRAQIVTIMAKLPHEKSV